MNKRLPGLATLAATTTLLIAANAGVTVSAASNCKITLDIGGRSYVGNPHLWEREDGLAYWGGKFWHAGHYRVLEVTVKTDSGRVARVYTVPNANFVKTIQSGDHTNGKVCRGLG